MSDYSDEGNESIETFPWMETEHKDSETVTIFNQPRLDENSPFGSPSSRKGMKSRGISSTFMSNEVPEDAKKCMFYYLPGVLFGKKLNPR